jgi:tumor protein p53-inducible protein 3
MNRDSGTNESVGDITESVRAIVFDQPGDESVLRIAEVPAPKLVAGSIRIRVHATAVNRADLLQRQGRYPPPPGASDILGLECSGEVVEVAGDVADWTPGHRVMALLAGGGYAEEVVVDARSAMRIPDVLSFEEGGAIPEVFFTSFLNLFMIGGADPAKRLLVHGGGSGVGTASILLCREMKVPIAVTVGSDEKGERCRDLGASLVINYRSEDFVEKIRTWTGGSGVDLLLDHLGGSYLSRNIASLAMEGHLVMIGSMGGTAGELDVGRVLSRRIRITGSTLRARTPEQKGEIVLSFLERFGEALERGRIRPVIHRIFPLERAGEAHKVMAAGENFGKVVLSVSP